MQGMSLPALALEEVEKDTVSFGKESLDIYARDSSSKNRNNESNKRKDKYPVVFMIHGGAWVGGDKTDSEVGAEKAEFFLDKGYVYVSTNYRLAPKNKYPSQLEDVRKALDWTRKNIKRWHGDAGQIIIVGHSAGGHLAALLALASPTNVKALVLLDPAALDLGDTYKQASKDGKKQMTAVFGKGQDRLNRASPLFQMRNSDAKLPPTLILLSRDWLGKRSSANALLRGSRMRRKSAAIVLQEYDHLTLLSELGKNGERSTQLLTDFIK